MCNIKLNEYQKIFDLKADILITGNGPGENAAAVLKKMNLKKINKLANEFASEMCSVEGALPSDDLIYSKYISEFENGS